MAGGEGGGSGGRAAPWTEVGDLSSAGRLAVDPAGYLWPLSASWGVDWWIGANDRWYVPAREAAVRQSLLDEAPIVQTALKVQGGDVWQRVVVVPGAHGSEAVVEVTNESNAPVALAVAIRPTTLEGRGWVERVALRGQALEVDGAPVLRFDDRPRQRVLATASDGDLCAAVTAEATVAMADGEVEDPAGLAGGAIVVPVAHGVSWQYRIALDAAVADRRRWRLGRPQVSTVPEPPVRQAAVDLASAARGWRAQVERVTRLDLPDDRFSALMGPVRAHLTLAGGAPPDDLAVAAEVAVAVATAGGDLADADALVEAANSDRGPGCGPGLWAAGKLVAFGSPVPDAATVAGVAEAALHHARRHDQLDVTAWTRAGLRAATGLLLARGEERAARTTEEWDGALGAGEAVASWLGLALGVGSAPPVGPAGLHGSTDAEEALLAVWGAAAAGDPSWFGAAQAVAALASPTQVWPRTAAGGGPAGPSALALARAWAAMRSALVAEVPGGVAMLPAWPEAWRGQPLEVHGLRTGAGILSFALRWHGERPALLWSLDGALPGTVVRAPGIDPGWRGEGGAGEALLASPAQGGDSG